MIEYGWHITEKKRLLSISKQGLLPQCGERTRAFTSEPDKSVYFTLHRGSVLRWKELLYPEKKFDNLSVLQLSIKQDFLNKNIYWRGSNLLDCKLREGFLPSDRISVLRLFDKGPNTQISFDDFVAFYGQHASLSDKWLAREGIELRATPITNGL